jgi:hypothetical protein
MYSMIIFSVAELVAVELQLFAGAGAPAKPNTNIGIRL